MGGIILKNTYTFPAVFDYADDGISIEFPDLPGCLPCAHSTEEAVKNAQSALGLHLWGMEKDDEEIPEPTDVRNLEHKENQAVMLVNVFMPATRDKINNQFVRKTLSIPAWLNSRAEQEQVNFSRILQEGLKEYLHIQE
jgi:predicted RNase H-like HicB family nuclease